jgi:hypothetical protein
MKNTRFMEVLFSATEDEELQNQVSKDIEDAKVNGSVDTDELKYEHVGDGKVVVTDKGNGEETVVEGDAENGYDLYPAEMTQQIEGFIHPEGDGVTPGEQKGAEDEHVEEHLEPEAQVEEHVNPEAGAEASVEVAAEEGREPRAEDAEDQVCPECGKTPCECEKEGEEKEFSVSTDNTVVQRIFSDQEFCERLFSEVIESEETAKVGDLKVEKVDDNSVVVTSESTGDQAKVTLDDEEMEVTELDSKNFSDVEGEGEDGNFLPAHVVGVDAFNHVIVDAPVYSDEEAEELVGRLQEDGVDAVQVFESEDEARDYAMDLLNNLGADEVDEPEEATFSDTDKFDLFTTRYYSNNTVYMDRLFSEAANDVETSQEVIEDAIENGEQIENDSEIVTPVDANTAVIEDKENEEFTKVTINNNELHFRPIGEGEAEELTSHLEVDSVGAGSKSDEDRVEEGREETKDFSETVMEKYFSDCEDEVYCDNDETKFFSESEEMTDYMVRLFSEESDSEKIEDAIESGEEIENDTEIITPVDAKTAVVEDKENGEFTKAELSEGEIELHPISEEEAKDLKEDVVAEEEKKEEAPVEEKEEEKEDEKKFSAPLSKFFAEAGIAPAAAPVAAPATAEFIVDENGNPVQPVAAAEEAPVAVPSAEAIEDKALAAVQSIQAAAAEMEAQVLNAKAAPVEGAEQDLQEAHFSETAEEKTFSENDTIVSWLGSIKK